MGRVAGPFPSPPPPNLQCHTKIVVSKKHTTEWRTIHHLSYPKGVSINDHIPKDPYSLQYVRVDDAISVLKSLGPTWLRLTLSQSFALSPFTRRLEPPRDILEGSILCGSLSLVRALVRSFPVQPIFRCVGADF